MDVLESRSYGDKVVARGYLENFSTAAVLQALSISRRFTAVHFYLKDGSPVGRVLLKSGMVLDAELSGSGVSGVEALGVLLN